MIPDESAVYEMACSFKKDTPPGAGHTVMKVTAFRAGLRGGLQFLVVWINLL